MQYFSQLREVTGDVQLAGITASIAEFALRKDPGVSDAALDMAERAVVDTIGVAFAAAQEDTVLALTRAWEGRLPPGPCAIIARGALPAGLTTGAVGAALLNGTAAHALDYDDVADSMKGHPSAVLLPALLAVGQEIHTSGRALLEALCIGFQIDCALADGLGIESHYSRGWHSTATVGVIAAAASASRVLHSDVLTTRHALGIAASMACGSRQNFGTMTKPLHAGLAASNGVHAALLASAGFTADEDQLEAPLGYLFLYGAQPFDPGRLYETLNGDWKIVSRGLNVKLYPSCYDTSRTADAALATAASLAPGDAKVGISHIADVAEVSVVVEPGGLRPLIHHRPQTGLEGKFSLELVAAAALVDRRISLATFTDDAVRRPEVQALLRKVTVTEHGIPPIGPATWHQSYSVVRVRRRDGTSIEAREDVPLGHAARPLSEAQLRAKFEECLAYGAPNCEAAPLFDTLRSLRSCRVLSELDLRGASAAQYVA